MFRNRNNNSATKNSVDEDVLKKTNTMKQSILNRIKALGGDVSKVKGVSLAEDLISITFNTVLYQRPTDTAWQTADDSEPIYGISDFVDANKALFDADKQAFYDKMLETFYQITKKGYGQMFWTAQMFTPFKEGTDDFEEWNDDFIDENLTDLSIIIAHANDPKPDLIAVFYSYSFPDNFYICSADPNPENPTLFGTDHEVFFNEITNEGTLEDMLNSFMTKDELLEIVKKALEK
jgi:hypothetical protein